jgi:hypothetical protein
MRAYRLYRVATVVELVGDASKPGRKRAFKFARNLVGVIAAPSISGVVGLFNQAKESYKLIQVLDKRGGAMIDDARNIIEEVFKKKSISKSDWAVWDGLLEEACKNLAEVSASRRDCTPGNYKFY